VSQRPEPVVAFIRLNDLLPEISAKLEKARTNDGWDSELLAEVVVGLFNFLGDLIDARIGPSPKDDASDAACLIIEFQPPEDRDDEGVRQAFASALERAGSGDVDGAKGALERVVKEFPEVAEYHCALGQAHLGTGDQESAEDELLCAVCLDGRDPSALTLLGNLYMQQRRPELAVGLYERSLELDRSVITLTNLGAALGETGDLHGAVESFRAANELEPTYEQALVGLHMALTRLEQSDGQGTD
jgi:Flp pilus assembly protein TadD